MKSIKILILAAGAICLAQSYTIPQNRTHHSGHQKKGIDFFLVGDYGHISNMTLAKRTFSYMDQVMERGNLQNDPRDMIDFILAAGDNIYPTVPDDPQDWEFDEVLSLFKSKNLQNLKVYAVRGNHDCLFDWNREIDLMQNYSNWYMPSLYYKEEFDLGNGKKFGLLNIDSCLMLCSNFSYEDNEEASSIDSGCDAQSTQWGNEQFTWIQQTLAEWAQDESIAWTGSMQHHLLFGKHYHDYSHIVDNYMPLLMQYKVDFYFNGHEHTMVYANYPYSQALFDDQFTKKTILSKALLEDYLCDYNVELHFGMEKTSQFYMKGDAIHQVTSGFAGRSGYSICAQKPSLGRFGYAQNLYNGFTQIHMDEDEVQIRYVGIDNDHLRDLYKVTVLAKNKSKVPHPKEGLDVSFLS